MPIEYSVDAEQQLITEVWSGEVRADDLAEHWRRYLRDPEVMSIRCTIVDLRKAVILIRGNEMDDLIRSVVDPVLGGRSWKTAIVVDNPLQFGVSRQYQAFAQHYSKDAIFHNMEEARTWLCDGADDGAK